MMSKRKALLVTIAFLLAADSVVAYGLSPVLTGRFLRFVNESVKAQKIAVLNLDDPTGEQWAEKLNLYKITR